MDSIISLLHSYHTFNNNDIKDRFFKHSDLLNVLDNLKTNPLFEIREVGTSVEGRSLNLIKCGGGTAKVFLWSQMHGNEATATMALMDLFNFLGDDCRDDVKDSILQNCTLYFLPMVNPDGAEVFNRRNALEIDINRDFHSQQSPEGRILRQLRDEIQPHFGFNLHDQTTMWSAGQLGNPATISLLAPAYDDALSINTIRQIAMQVIAEMNDTLQKVIPGHVGRFDDEYEMRAFGDNFQAAGTSTILIEAGGYADDPEKQHIRKLVFVAMMTGLLSIAERSFLRKTVSDYFTIPDNKLHHFQILLRNCKLQTSLPAKQIETANQNSEYTVDIGLIVKEKISDDLKSMTYTYLIGDIGDLSNRFGYKDIDCESFKLIPTNKIIFDEPADLVLMDGLEVLLAIENGVITNSTV
ncbi:M14 family zinc carboxypeptidase [Daejeonella lutea]|uniref:Zinc carboxypeptidase n=1 Tax=Daejeonella lutea TaxID=572036 RepID=A0A1T5ANT5_9SPHI|nr:M14 family zinc carboxypeptidase [Daejeonella lutea]SKB36586.1 Zinc carboxypeptidase [Daejeonella lutea]